jgi:hypothetical protein
MFSQRLLLAISISALILQAETDFRFAFPQSEILLGVDVKWLMKSPLGMSMKKDVKGNLGAFNALEPLMEQIDSVHLSVVSKNNKGSDLLMLVQGRFEAAKVIELGTRNGFRMEQWGKTKVLVPKKEKITPAKKVGLQNVQFGMEMPAGKPAFALYDSKNILIGEEAPLRVAIERMETGLTPQANPLFGRARDLESANDFWLVGSTAPLNLNAGSPKQPDSLSQMASQVRNFSLGMAIRRNVNLDIQIQTINPKAAAQMLDLLKGAMAMAKLNANPSEALPVDFDKMVELSSSGNLVRAAISMEQKDIDKILASGFMPGSAKPKIEGGEPADNATTPATAATATKAPAIVKPVEPVRKTVMIYGLPGGPKEVPVN